jgi:hypothetical protein
MSDLKAIPDTRMRSTRSKRFSATHGAEGRLAADGHAQPEDAFRADRHHHLSRAQAWSP